MSFDAYRGEDHLRLDREIGDFPSVRSEYVAARPTGYVRCTLNGAEITEAECLRLLEQWMSDAR